jgi:hypothetical protein
MLMALVMPMRKIPTFHSHFWYVPSFMWLGFAGEDFTAAVIRKELRGGMPAWLVVVPLREIGSSGGDMDDHLAQRGKLRT